MEPGSSEIAEPGAALPAGMGVTAEGGNQTLVPCGIHADGTACFHGIAPDAPVTQDNGRWQPCTDGQQVLTIAAPGTPELGAEGWELTPTPCPACGAKDEVLVREIVTAAGEPPDTAWEYFCPVCGDRGTGHPKQAAQ